MGPNVRWSFGDTFLAFIVLPNVFGSFENTFPAFFVLPNALLATHEAKTPPNAHRLAHWSQTSSKYGPKRLSRGPAWDYDLAFENDDRTYPINSLKDFIYAKAGSVASDATRDMVNRIVKEDAEARARLEELWDTYKPSLANLNDYVDEQAALLDASQRLNFKRWPILNQKVHQNPRALGSYEAEVNAVKTYITGRLERFDQLVHNK